MVIFVPVYEANQGGNGFLAGGQSSAARQCVRVNQGRSCVLIRGCFSHCTLGSMVVSPSIKIGYGLKFSLGTNKIQIRPSNLNQQIPDSKHDPRSASCLQKNAIYLTELFLCNSESSSLLLLQHVLFLFRWFLPSPIICVARRWR